MPPTTGETLRAWLLSALVVHGAVAGNPDAKRLYDDLLSNYNKLVRPVVNTSDVLKVCIKLKLSQLIDVNLKNQIMTTNLWVEQSWYDYKLRWEPKEYGGVQMLHVPSDHIWRPDISWYDYKLRWEPKEYGGVQMLHVPSDHIWRPDIVLYNNDMFYLIIIAFLTLSPSTTTCTTKNINHICGQVDLRHMDEQSGSNIVDVGVDLSEFYMSVEWDILEVPAVRNEKFYTCCDEPYLDITFNITMRRKTLFYTVNIIIPCMGISFLTVLTFYLPSDSGEKVIVPLLGKYLIFAMILVSISICVTVVVLNVHFRSPQTHRMAPWVNFVFIQILPRVLFMRRPQYSFESKYRKHLLRDPHISFYPYYSTSNLDQIARMSRSPSKEDMSPSSLTATGPFGGSCQIHGPVPHSESEDLSCEADLDEGATTIKSPIIPNPGFSHSHCPQDMHKSCFYVRFIAEHTKMLEDSTKVKEDWKYVAMVLDRLFLWIFTLAVLVGTAAIILQAPTLYDDRIPIIDKKFPEFASATVMRCPPQ
uniref:Acetylcholine receptor n=2 Tax=Lutzomyia longipalpis TaxID=7200 RepID=A0A1B0CM19_LUTLO